MAVLEDLTVGSSVKGLIVDTPVTIVAAKWRGNEALEITFKDNSGKTASQLLFRGSEVGLEVLSEHLPWSFDADGAKLRLASEAYRIHLAHLFDPYLAVHTSSVEPLPHQIAAVYQEMLPRLPLRYVLADDPGAGKTIMTGLYIKELIMRGDLKRCLIVSPGSLVEQWQDELLSKFGLNFEILTKERIMSASSGNVFTEVERCICRLDKLARNEELQAKLKASDWDLIVCDEAHKMSATVWGGDVKYTHRYQLGQLLSTITRHFLLLTATPHNGKEEDFQLFLSLIDADRFEGARRASAHPISDVNDVMRRLVKEDLLTFEGKKLFPERCAYTINYDFSDCEAELYDAVTEYVRAEFNRADKLKKDRKNSVGFALTILQRRLASSPEAIYQSLKRRRQRLEQRLDDMRIGKYLDDMADVKSLNFDDIDEDDFTAEEQEKMVDQLVDRASAAASIAELEKEICTLEGLEHMANEVRVSGVDRKWDELSKLLQSSEFKSGNDGTQEKLIIFTEHRDTLNYLTDKIRSLLGNDEAVVTIHGGVSRDERHKAEELFKQDVGVRIMIATDAAGEGINLQRAHLMINYDLPWNPNRMEQRFGRIHRIGQTEVCHLWNLVANGSREGMVFQRLFNKLEEERNALGGKVFDVLGSLTFDNKPLRDLLIEAIRAGNESQVQARMQQVMDKVNSEMFQKLIEERALTADVMNIQLVQSIREEMERIEARKLQPHFIESFFLEAFKELRGTVRPTESGRYRIDSVPYSVQNSFIQTGYGRTVLKRYESVCFDKTYCNVPGKPKAVLICPGHPLMEAVISLVRKNNADVMKRGAIFIDESDYGTDARLLVYINTDIQDGVLDSNGQRRIISRQIHFVEIKEDGSSAKAGYAPYLDYSPATESEQTVVQAWLKEQTWLTRDVEDQAQTFAVTNLVRPHLQEVKSQRLAVVDKTAKAVQERLRAEIQYWDNQANELAEKEAAGKGNAKQNAVNARHRADDLENRMKKRLAELDLERQISSVPPVIVGGALVIPRGLLYQLMGATVPASDGQQNRRAVEYAAMNAVMNIERSLGFDPHDVSAAKCGYDVESFVPEALQEKLGSALRMIEVKGRTAGATSVTVSKNEILTALNKPDAFILALVEVNGSATRTIYLKRPFEKHPDFAATSVNYDMRELINKAEVVWREM